MIIMFLMIWLTGLNADDPRLRHDFARVAAHCFGAWVAQGFPAKMRFCKKGKMLTLMFLTTALITNTIYSSLIIKRLMESTKITQIESINDLEESGKKILVVEGSYVMDILSGSDLSTRFANKIEYLNTNDVNSMKSDFKKVLNDTHVLLTDRSIFLNYARIFSDHLSTRTLHIAKVFDSVPSGWIFPKLRRNATDAKFFRERFIVGLQWLNDLGLYKSYDQRASNRFWSDKVASTTESNLRHCNCDYGSEKYDEDETTTQKQALTTHHFYRLFRFTGIMYTAAFVVFICEILWFHCFKSWLFAIWRNIRSDIAHSCRRKNRRQIYVVARSTKSTILNLTTMKKT